MDMDLNQQGSAVAANEKVIDAFIKKVNTTATKEVSSGTTCCSSEKPDSQEIVETSADITNESKSMNENDNELFCTEKMLDEEIPTKREDDSSSRV